MSQTPLDLLQLLPIHHNKAVFYVLEDKMYIFKLLKKNFLKKKSVVHKKRPILDTVAIITSVAEIIHYFKDDISKIFCNFSVYTRS